MRRASITCIVLSALLAGAPGQADPMRVIEGIVVDAAGRPVADALLRLRASDTAARSDAEGRFTLVGPAIGAGIEITAAKPGYVIAGQALGNEAIRYRLVLRPIAPADERSYAWVSAYALADRQGPIEDTGREPCGTCHRRIAEEWQSSRHAGSALNPIFNAFYYGAGGAERPGQFPSHHHDFPNSNGTCVHCHLPALALRIPRDADPTDASGVEREGIGCDFCHKIAEVDPDPAQGRIGAQAALLRRPGGGAQLVLGPLDDVPRGRDAFSPVYRDSRYCGICHDGGFWGIPAYSEFKEWQETELPARGIHCQDCHMLNAAKAETVADAGPEIIRRAPEGLSSHRFHDSLSPGFVRRAIDFRLTAGRATTDHAGADVSATVAIANTGAGHHLPTGTPMRHMLLVLEARDAEGRLLQQSAGERVPEWGGTEEGPVPPLAGLPGKAFAKILQDRLTYFGDRHLDPLFPAPHWRPTFIAWDNRLARGATDVSAYGFALAVPERFPVTVTARLIIRRTFQAWALEQGLPDIEVEIARESIVVER
ncbi:MAG: hypothetical protein HYR63_08085 [Proteobacteria bacterium]|nr:hypothetical protein [Pseudomonadota bacterium]MBI3499776.1 hypothetical protein [Pseudomonadota bacterium]